jgi:hypothetical protein
MSYLLDSIAEFGLVPGACVNCHVGWCYSWHLTNSHSFSAVWIMNEKCGFILCTVTDTAEEKG